MCENKVCNYPKSDENTSIEINDKDFPFLCMDLTFMYAILANGYGLSNEKEIYVIFEF